MVGPPTTSVGLCMQCLYHRDMAYNSRPCGRQDLGYHAVNVPLCGAVIDNACPQAELAAQGCVGQIDPAALDDALQDCGVVPIEFVFRRGFVPYMAEADRAKFDRCEQFEVRVLGESYRQALRHIQILLDCGAESLQPVIAQ